MRATATRRRSGGHARIHGRNRPWLRSSRRERGRPTKSMRRRAANTWPGDCFNPRCFPMRIDAYDLDEDPAGTWTQEQLLEMDARFVAALERAFAAGLESRQSARREVKVRAGAPRWSTPLPPEILAGLLRSAESASLAGRA